jgi:hypothetical protein
VPNSLASFGITPVVEIPDSFDWRNQINLSPILDQAACGSCFSMASASAISDRIIVAQYQTKTPITNIVINPLQLLVCDTNDSGCEGGNIYNILFLAMNTGAVDQNSSPFWSDWCNSNCCSDQSQSSCNINNFLPDCSSYNNDKKYKIINGSINTLYDERNLENSSSEETINKIKKDIMLYGPVVSSYQVFRDFQYGSAVHSGDIWPSTGGIYIYDRTSPHSGGHSVVIVGWDKKVIPSYGEVPYWIVKNSWGTNWGENGYFKMAMSNPSKYINIETGLDIPYVYNEGSNRYIYGGAYSFQIDLNNVPNIKLDTLQNCCFLNSGTCSKVKNCESPNYVVDDCSKCSIKMDIKIDRKWIVWVVVGIVVILILIILFSR